MLQNNGLRRICTVFPFIPVIPLYTDSALHDEPMLKSLFADCMDEWPPELSQRVMWCSSRGIEEARARHELRRHHAQDDAFALMVAFRENCAGWGC